MIDDMIFFVNVAATVNGETRNIRLQFPSRPAIRELAAALETEMKSTERRNAPFLVDAVYLLDDYTAQWVAVYSAAQLRTDCQIYAVSANGTKELPTYLPPTRHTLTMVKLETTQDASIQ